MLYYQLFSQKKNSLKTSLKAQYCDDIRVHDDFM